jgi:hypothetical protein
MNLQISTKMAYIIGRGNIEHSSLTCYHYVQLTRVSKLFKDTEKHRHAIKSENLPNA